MSASGQNNQIEDNAVEGAEGGQEEDDDFGDFEGFEGGVERMQAMPAPSPWATFPDLLPVQTSPATPADDAQASTSRMGNGHREVWQPAVAGNAVWPGPSVNREDLRPAPQQMRTLNPPDVSLNTNQAIGGRITPDNVHDAALAVVMDHIEGGVAADARIPVVAQIDRLQQRLEDADQNRAHLEEQIEGLRQRNVELEQQVASNNAQLNELQTRLQRNQETLEQLLVELRQHNSVEWRQDLRQIQEEVAAIKQLQIAEKSLAETSRQNVDEMKSGIYNRLQNLEANIERANTKLEAQLSSRLDEQCQQVQAAIGSIVERTAQQVSSNLSQLLGQAVQNSHDTGGHQENNILQSIKVELEKHNQHQQMVMEQERQVQLGTLSNALQSALLHLQKAMGDGPKLNDRNFS